MSNSLRATPREGIALPIALAAIIAVGALIAGVIFASSQEYRVGRSSMTSHSALHAAEVGLSSVVSTWNSTRTTNARVGFTTAMADTVIGGTIVQRQFTRVSPTMFWVTSTALAGGQSLQGRSLKRVNALVRVDIPNMRIQGAITVRGNISVSGVGSISGQDTTPPGWNDCTTAGGTAAGVVVGDSATNASGSGNCAGFSCISGTPKIADSSIYADSMTYKNFDGFNYDSLTKLASADKIYTSSKNSATIDNRSPQFNLDQTCNRTHVNNWGDTSRVNGPPGCREYFPVIWLKGSNVTWTVNGMGGQGILLVDGNLSIAGQMQWTGLILVQGTFSTSGMTTPKVIGGVMAMNRGNGTNSISGNARVVFSRCAIQAVTARLATSRLARYRSWADMAF